MVDSHQLGAAQRHPSKASSSQHGETLPSQLPGAWDGISTYSLSNGGGNSVSRSVSGSVDLVQSASGASSAATTLSGRSSSILEHTSSALGPASSMGTAPNTTHDGSASFAAGPDSSVHRAFAGSVAPPASATNGLVSDAGDSVGSGTRSTMVEASGISSSLSGHSSSDGGGSGTSAGGSSGLEGASGGLTAAEGLHDSTIAAATAVFGSEDAVNSANAPSPAAELSSNAAAASPPCSGASSPTDSGDTAASLSPTEESSPGATDSSDTATAGSSSFKPITLAWNGMPPPDGISAAELSEMQVGWQDGGQLSLREKLRRKRIGKSNSSRAPWNKGLGAPKEVNGIPRKWLHLDEKALATRMKQSAAAKGRIAWNKGKKHSDEWRANIAAATGRAMKRKDVNDKVRCLPKRMELGLKFGEEIPKPQNKSGVQRSTTRKRVCTPDEILAREMKAVESGRERLAEEREKTEIQRRALVAAGKIPDSANDLWEASFGRLGIRPTTRLRRPGTKVVRKRSAAHNEAIARGVRQKWADPEWRETVVARIKESFQKAPDKMSRLDSPVTESDWDSAAKEHDRRAKKNKRARERRASRVKEKIAMTRANAPEFYARDKADAQRRLTEAKSMVAQVEGALADATQQMRTANVTVTMEAKKVRDRAEALLAAAKERVNSLERSIEKQSTAEQLLFETAHKHGFGALLGDIDKLNQFRHVPGMVVPPKPLWLRRQQIFKNTDQASIRPLTINLREQLDLRADHLREGKELGSFWAEKKLRPPTARRAPRLRDQLDDEELSRFRGDEGGADEWNDRPQFLSIAGGFPGFADALAGSADAPEDSADTPAPAPRRRSKWAWIDGKRTKVEFDEPENGASSSMDWPPSRS